MTTATSDRTGATTNPLAGVALALGILAVLAHLLLPARLPAVGVLGLAGFVVGMVARRRAQEGAPGGELANAAVGLAVLAFATGYVV